MSFIFAIAIFLQLFAQNLARWYCYCELCVLNGEYLVSWFFSTARWFVIEPVELGFGHPGLRWAFPIQRRRATVLLRNRNPSSSIGPCSRLWHNPSAREWTHSQELPSYETIISQRNWIKPSKQGALHLRGSNIFECGASTKLCQSSTYQLCCRLGPGNADCPQLGQAQHRAFSFTGTSLNQLGNPCLRSH